MLGKRQFGIIFQLPQQCLTIGRLCLLDFSLTRVLYLTTCWLDTMPKLMVVPHAEHTLHLHDLPMQCWLMNWANAALMSMSTTRRQLGQLSCSRSQGARQLSWKTCEHGSRV